MKTKKCENINCDETFETMNVKKKFCCLYCKNQANYFLKQKTYPWEIKMAKVRRKNIQILEGLYQRNEKEISPNSLAKCGFDMDAAMLPSINNENKNVFRFGNLGLVAMSQSQFIIIKF